VVPVSSPNSVLLRAQRIPKKAAAVITKTISSLEKKVNLTFAITMNGLFEYGLSDRAE
jgi:hypothetical protein